MIAKIFKKLYNIFNYEREVDILMLKPFNYQISIFLTDGIMNPSKYLSDISETFSNLFKNEILLLNLEDAPADMPLLKYNSADNKCGYDFAKKRINFYMNFDENDSIDKFEEYKNNIYKFINKIILKHSDISRVGIVVNYYINKRDDNNNYWVKKYNLPLFSDKTSELTYSINNNFLNKGLKYNKIITLTNGKLNNIKKVPIVSIDVNNLPTAKLSTEQLNYIFNDINCYLPELLKNELKINETN